MPKNWLVMEGDGSPAPFRARLAGAGRHLPATVLTTDELMATTRHHTHIDLERLTGIHERRVSIGDEDSYSLATAAAQDCLSLIHIFLLARPPRAPPSRPLGTITVFAPQ